MTHVNLPNHPDVVMIYQERDSVEPAIQQIMQMGIKLKTYKFDPRKLHEIAAMKAKVVLLSSNDVKKTIQFYIEYLEEFEQHITPHSAVLLINNRETACAYLACENGLFDNYAIINPLNEPFRLKLVLLQELKIIADHKNNTLDNFIANGEDEIASCIEHGVALKNSFLNEVKACEKSIFSATDDIIDNKEAKAVLQNLIGLSLEEMNDNISSNIQDILNQLIDLKINNQALKENIEQNKEPKKKTLVGINTDVLISHHGEAELPAKSVRYKIVIAEPSNLFVKVIHEIFSETAFEYKLVSDGQETLTTIETFKPDVVLLAYDLPRLNGIDITKKLRDKGNKVPIIAYTHHRDKEEITRWLPLGISGYLIKPSKKSAILKSVDMALKQSAEVTHHHKNGNIHEIHWSAEYSVGNVDIDEQHKMLFQIINEFFHKDSKAAAIAVFQDVTSYIDLHFEAEESLLRQINFPETADHIKKHDELRDKFQLIQDKLDNYDADVHHKIAMFLSNWVTQHILKSDMAYRAYALDLEEPSFK